MFSLRDTSVRYFWVSQDHYKWCQSYFKVMVGLSKINVPVIRLQKENSRIRENFTKTEDIRDTFRDAYAVLCGTYSLHKKSSFDGLSIFYEVKDFVKSQRLLDS